MATDLTTQTGVIEHMSAATSESDWNDRAKDVKEANGGFPSFWFQSIVMSGVMAETAAKWGGDANIHISFIK